jgi:hypothetical protein
VATQLSDMSLGGSGFAAGYTPIRFAPLVSLTGPVMAPATPAAPEAAAPMAPALRLPQMSDMPDNAYMTGEMQQGTPGAGFVNPFSGMSGSQIARTGMDALSFFTNPLGFASQYALTGKTPSQNFQGLFSGGLQGLLGGGGQQRPEVPLGPMAPAVDSRAGITSFQNAYNLGLQYGLGEEASNAAGSAAASLVARGVDPITAVTLAMQNASMAATQMDMAGSPFGQPAAQPAAPQFAPQGLSPAARAQMAADAIAVNPIGGGGFAPSDFGGYGGGVAGETGAPGESSFGLDR